MAVSSGPLPPGHREEKHVSFSIWKNNKLLICPLERQHCISAGFTSSVALGSLE